MLVSVAPRRERKDMEFFPLCIDIKEEGMEIEFMDYLESAIPPKDLKMRVVNTWNSIHLLTIANGSLHIECNPTIYRKDMISGEEEINKWMWWRAPYPMMLYKVDIPLPENVQDAVYAELKKHIPVCTDPNMTVPRKRDGLGLSMEEILNWHYKYPVAT